MSLTGRIHKEGLLKYYVEVNRSWEGFGVLNVEIRRQRIEVIT
jgi:hypothetical protein